MSLITVSREELRFVAEAVTGALRRIVRPVVIEAPDKHYVGTGQVLRVAGRLVLVTAGHNLAEYGVRTKEIAYRVGISPTLEISLPSVHWLDGPRLQAWGSAAQLTHADSSDIREIHIDVGVVEISQPEVALLDIDVVDADSIFAGRVPDGMMMMLHGFPAAISRRERVDQGVVTARFMTFATVSPPEQDWPTNWSPLLHQVAVWPATGTERLQGDRLVVDSLPAPQGISGSAMWSVVYRQDEMFNPRKDLLLAGIQYAHEPQRGLVVGVNMDVVASLISHVFPDTRDELVARGFRLAESDLHHMDAP